MNRPSWRSVFWGLLFLGALRLGFDVVRELAAPGALTRTVLAFIRSHTGWRATSYLATDVWISALILLAVVAILAVRNVLKPRAPSVLSMGAGGGMVAFGEAAPGGAIAATANRAYGALARIVARSGGLTVNRVVIGGLGLIGGYLALLYWSELNLVLAGRVQPYRSSIAFFNWSLIAPPPLAAFWRLWYLHTPSVTICGWLAGGLLLTGIIVRFASGMSRGLTKFTLARTALGWAMLLFMANLALVYFMPMVQGSAVLLAALVFISIIWGLFNFPITDIVSVALLAGYFVGFILFDYVVLWIFAGLPYANLIYVVAPFLAIGGGALTFVKLAAAFAFGIEALEKAVPNIYGNARTADVNDYVLAGLFGEDATVQAMNTNRRSRAIT